MEEELLLAGKRQPTNPFHIGVILVRFKNHIRKARLKSLTLSYFNHTAGRRFLPFGITAISIWFGDYLSLTTQGDLLCVLKLSYPYVPPQA